MDANLLYLLLGFLSALSLVGLYFGFQFSKYLKRQQEKIDEKESHKVSLPQVQEEPSRNKVFSNAPQFHSKRREPRFPRKQKIEVSRSPVKAEKSEEGSDKVEAKKKKEGGVIGSTNTKVSDFYQVPAGSGKEELVAEEVGLNMSRDDDEVETEGAMSPNDIQNLKHPVKRGLPFPEVIESFSRLLGMGQEPYLKELYKKSEAEAKAFFRENIPTTRDDGRIDENIRAMLKEFNIG